MSLKRKIPQLAVRIVRSPDIGVIGVGEGTTPNFPRHLFEYLGISRGSASTSWPSRPGSSASASSGARGRSSTTRFEPQLDSHWTDLPRPNGYYCDESSAAPTCPAP